MIIIIITRCWHVTISCQPDGRPPQPVRPWKCGRVHLAEGRNVVVLEQEISESVQCNFFHFLITSWKSDDFSLRYGDISFLKMAAVRHLGIVLPPYVTTHEVPVAGCSCLSNFMSIWYSALKILLFEFFAYLAWNAYSSPQNWGFVGLWTPNCD